MSYIYETTEPIVETKFGKLRGYTYGGINHFLGVKYARAKRFMMPEEIESWEGIKDAKGYGPVMLQMRPFHAGNRASGMAIPWEESEDCQNLNIWAPKHDDGKKRPVFVWMHGGGFFSGSAITDNTTDGFNMAHDGDVVFVSINHRLNLLGHLNLADYGEKYKNSINVGIADLVAALKWIHENIAAFGGDPDNVTICGHSGGGGKVICMYQIEEAKDYFAKGIVMSGVLDDGPETTDADSRRMAGAMMDFLGITKENIEKASEISYAELLGAYRAVAKKLKSEGVNIGMSPVANDYFRGFPIDGDFCSWSKDKPMMLSTTLSEFNFKVRIPESVKEKLTEDEKLAMIRERFGSGADELLALFRKAYLDHNILDLMYLDADFRRPTYVTAIKKANCSAAKNTFVYLFAFNMPTDCRVPAWHGADVAYAFFNADKSPVCNEPVYGEQNSNALKNAYLNFIRCGDPNNDYLPAWRPFTDADRCTMVIDKKNELKTGFDEELIALYKKLCPPLNFSPEL